MVQLRKALFPSKKFSDESQFTTGVSENPTLTIVSLAIRRAEHIAKEMSKGTI